MTTPTTQPRGWRRVLRALPGRRLRAPLLARIGAVTLVVMLFALSRAVYFPLFEVAPDSLSYLQQTADLCAGKWPDCSVRPPAYAIFMWVILGVTGRLGVVVYVQAAMTLAAVLTAGYALIRVHGTWGWWAAGAVLVAACSYSARWYDTNILTDSPAAALLVFSAAALCVGLSKRNAAALGASSACWGLGILLRADGLSTAPVYVLVTAFLLWNRYGRRAILAYAIPLPALVLCLCLTNLAGGAGFTVSRASRINKLGVVATYLAESDAYPAPVRKALREFTASIPPEQLRAARESWDPSRTMPVFQHSFDRLIYDCIPAAVRASGLNEDEADRLYGDIYWRSIRRNPGTFAKYVLANVYWFFMLYRPTAEFLDYTPVQAERHRGILNTPFKRTVYRNHGVAAEPPSARPFGALTGVVTRCYIALGRSQRLLFGNGIWRILFLAAMVVSLVFLARSKGRDPQAFFVVALTLLPWAAAILTALVAYAVERYAYKMDFTLYLAPVLAARMVVGAIRGRASPRVNQKPVRRTANERGP